MTQFESSIKIIPANIEIIFNTISDLKNLEKIKEDVSEYAVKKDDGREFVAEVFKGLIKGKKYDEYIMNLYKRLHGIFPKLMKLKMQ